MRMLFVMLWESQHLQHRWPPRTENDEVMKSDLFDCRIFFYIYHGYIFQWKLVSSMKQRDYPVNKCFISPTGFVWSLKDFIREDDKTELRNFDYFIPNNYGKSTFLLGCEQQGTSTKHVCRIWQLSCIKRCQNVQLLIFGAQGFKNPQ